MPSDKKRHHERESTESDEEKYGSLILTINEERMATRSIVLARLNRIIKPAVLSTAFSSWLLFLFRSKERKGTAVFLTRDLPSYSSKASETEDHAMSTSSIALPFSTLFYHC